MLNWKLIPHTGALSVSMNSSLTACPPDDEPSGYSYKARSSGLYTLRWLGQ
ncbi:MAG: hypothetical protein HZB18_06240 [Chloroflexi bacterium]|nr:hypothetical protein [Chloroflexota bacterium]